MSFTTSWHLISSLSAAPSQNRASSSSTLTIKCRRIPVNEAISHNSQLFTTNPASVFTSLSTFTSIPFSFQRAQLCDFNEEIGKHLKTFIGKEGSKLLLRDVETTETASGSLLEIHIENEPKESNLDLIARNKMKGNDAFKMKEWGDAIKHYKAGIWLSSRESSHGNVSVNQLEMQCRSNLSQIYIYAEKPKKAVLECNKVLEMDGENVKMLFRRAVAHRMEQAYDEALKDLDKALEVEPENPLLLKERMKVKKLKQQYLDKSKKMFKGMFADNSALSTHLS